MRTIGHVYVSKHFKSDFPGAHTVPGNIVECLEKAVGDSSYLCLSDTGLVDVPKKFVLIHIPFKRVGPYLIPIDLPLTEQMVFTGRMNLEINPADKMAQIAWIYKNYPEYHKREQSGEFYPNGIWPVYNEFGDMLQKADDAIRAHDGK